MVLLVHQSVQLWVFVGTLSEMLDYSVHLLLHYVYLYYDSNGKAKQTPPVLASPDWPYRLSVSVKQ